MIALLLGVWMLCSQAAAETVRIGLFIGNDVGRAQDAPLTYAEQEARDMARLFQSMGDLSRDRTVLLTGASVAEVRDAVFQTEALAREVSARGDDVMIIFYYSGHASSDGLHLAGGLLPMAMIQRWLENSAAQIRVAFVDACESGTLAQVRGGTPVGAVEITVDETLTMSGLAIVTSTGPLSVARESASFGGGVFSQALLSGLRGSADVNGDGEITLHEAYDYAFAETVVGSASMDSGIQKPERRFDLSGVGAVVLTRLPSRAAGLILPEELEGVYTVVSVSNGQVVARIEKAPGEQRRLALPTGRYVVRKVRQEDVLLAEVDLAWGGDRWLSEEQMASVSLGDPLARGGWNLRPWRVTVRGLAASALLQGTPPTAGLGAEVRYLARPTAGLVLFGENTVGARENWSALLATSTTQVGAGLVLEQHLPRLDLSAAAGAQAALITQQLEYVDFEDGEIEGLGTVEADALAVGLWLGGGAHLPLGPTFGLDLTARGQLYRAEVDGLPTALLNAQAGLGLSASFGGRQRARARRRE